MPEVKVEGASIVFVGAFNPSIFQPAWFAAEGLIAKEEAEEADLSIVHPEVVVFSAEWFSLEVTRERWHASSVQPPFFDALRDLAVGAFTILHYTPVRMVGLNRDWHFQAESEEDWHAIGHRLAPMLPWEGILTNPGMRSLTMEGVRPDAHRGFVRVKVEPSLTVKHGIYVSVNDHYDVEDTDSAVNAADLAVQTVAESWTDSLGRSAKIVEQLLKRRADGP
jgi:hypothetical protein